MYPAWEWLRLLVAGPESEGALTLPATGFPFWQYLIKVFLILGVLLGVLMLAVYLLKRFLPPYRAQPPLIRVLATHYLAPKQALILVAVGQETFLLASSAGQLSIVPVAAAPVELAALMTPSPPGAPED